MALATRCPHCQTTFRVANDQLKLHAGIVRCGQCRQVFNGIEHLLPPAGIAQTAQTGNAAAAPETGSDDVGGPILPEAAIKRSAGAAESGLPSGVPAAAATTEDAAAHHDADPDDALEELDYGALEGMTLMHFPPAEPAAQQDVPAVDTNGAPLAQEAPDAAQRDGENAAAPDPRIEQPSPAKATTAAAPSCADDAQEPGFVTAARSRQRSRSRLLLGAGSAILALVLLAQTGFALRNQIAAQLPQAKPALLAICRALGCSIVLPARIDAITIESSELQAQPGSAGTLVLTLLLRNRSSTAQAWPHIELTLNDGNERVILRRVFTPREFPVSAADIAKGIAADTEPSVRLAFKLNRLKASGYRAVLFYP